MDPFAPPADDGFSVLFGLALLVVLAGFLFTGYAVVRGARAAKRAGIDPFTPRDVLLAQAVAGRRPQSLEQRLAELDDLHRRGVISAEEHRMARAKALTGGG